MIYPVNTLENGVRSMVGCACHLLHWPAEHMALLTIQALIFLRDYNWTRGSLLVGCILCVAKDWNSLSGSDLPFKMLMGVPSVTLNEALIQPAVENSHSSLVRGM
jgi:hypothetical protein